MLLLEWFTAWQQSEFEVAIDAQLLVDNDKGLANDTRNLAIGMGGAVGLLGAMPEDVTNWDKVKIMNNPNGLLDNYNRNVSKGPVWDNDDPILNYVGHPLYGAAYYTLSRHNGKSPFECFGYAFAMSTFFWEFGFEAFAEVPSMRDLILFPVISALIGEVFFRYEKQIRAGDGKVLGSKVIKDAKADIVVKRYRPSLFEAKYTTLLGIQFNFKF